MIWSPDISASLPLLLSTIVTHACTLHGKDAMDLSSAVRAVAVGFVGEAVSVQPMRQIWLSMGVGFGSEEDRSDRNR